MGVVIYTTPTCGYCHAAKQFFTQRNVPYEERDVATDPAAAQEMVRLSGQQGVPVIVVDGQVVVGFDRSRLQQLLTLHQAQPIRFGAAVADARQVTARKGLTVTDGAYVGRIRAGSLAERAGLRPDDIVVELAGHPIRSAEDMEAAVSHIRRGDRVPLTFVRNGQTQRTETT